jgi:penicillin-binding protein 1C
VRRTAAGLAGAGAAGAIAFAVCWVRYPFPEARLDAWDQTRLVTAADGTPLLALVGRDDQWRTPVPLDRVSPQLVAATIAIEDRRFRRHPGVDPVAVARAAWQNLTQGRVVSGASTLTMQVCRMMDDRPRTLGAKAIESFRALQLERLRDKDAILRHYLDVAPYGGNIRGVEAASRVWFGKPADRLSLAEAALIAGLPQSPERLRPDRNPGAARTRRNAVLLAMRDAGFIDEAARAAAAAEPVRVVARGGGGWNAGAIDGQPLAPHVAWMALAARPEGGPTTIEPSIQSQLARAVAVHQRTLPPGTDVAAVVIDVATSSIVALVGSADPGDPADGQVNGVLARRSPGSALKPFIYAAAMEAGRLAPDSLLPDAPIDRAGWRPGNFDRTFRGPVTASEALRDSLNIPAILLAEEIGLPRCIGVLEAVGLDLPTDAAARGGLSLAVGGIEVTLLDLTNAFATLARGGTMREPRLLAAAPDGAPVLSPLTAATITDMLSTRHRSPYAGGDVLESASTWFAWKSGTSSARRDAVAVGHNGRYAIGVWVGRFAGGGDVAYTGRTSAEPLLATLFAGAPLAVARDAAPPPPDAAAQATLARRPLDISRAAAATDDGDDRDATIRIESPRDGDRYIAWAGPVRLQPTARLVDPATGIARPQAAAGRWLLNGRPLPIRRGSPAPRLDVGPGRYELTFVGSDRRSDTVRFIVTATTSAAPGR